MPGGLLVRVLHTLLLICWDVRRRRHHLRGLHRAVPIRENIQRAAAVRRKCLVDLRGQRSEWVVKYKHWSNPGSAGAASQEAQQRALTSIRVHHPNMPLLLTRSIWPMGDFFCCITFSDHWVKWAPCHMLVRYPVPLIQPLCTYTLTGHFGR